MVSKMVAAKFMEGLLDGEEGEDIVTARQNVINRDNVKENWMLGPEKASVEPTSNADYWRQMADLWDVDERQARRQLCANCEYFNNTPAMQAQMDTVPLDAYDRDGGGRGYCVKFDFICHNLRVCQAWEEKSFETPDDENEE